MSNRTRMLCVTLYVSYSVFFHIQALIFLHMIGGGESFLGKNTFKLTL